MYEEFNMPACLLALNSGLIVVETEDAINGGNSNERER